MLLIRDEADRLVLRAVMPLGRTFETQYFHSVQLSPVEDLYHVRDGLVREWQGRVQAQGVGLPCVALSHGRFYVDPPWTVFEGEVMTLPEFALRVGTTVIGRNQLRLGNGEWTPLYPIFPGERLYVGTARQTLCARGEMVTRGNLDLR